MGSRSGWLWCWREMGKFGVRVHVRIGRRARRKSQRQGRWSRSEAREGEEGQARQGLMQGSSRWRRSLWLADGWCGDWQVGERRELRTVTRAASHTKRINHPLRDQPHQPRTGLSRQSREIPESDLESDGPEQSLIQGPLAMCTAQVTMHGNPIHFWLQSSQHPTSPCQLAPLPPSSSRTARQVFVEASIPYSLSAGPAHSCDRFNSKHTPRSPGATAWCNGHSAEHAGSHGSNLHTVICGPNDSSINRPDCALAEAPRQ